MYKHFFKRIFDILLALTLLLLLSPVLLIVSIAVLILMGWPVFFTQERPGWHEKTFKIYKFRSMMNTRDNDGRLLPDEQRITKFGTFLRESSLDELPELFNVLAGSMSFVGPRPLIIRYLPWYTEREKTRHNVRPGITGLAQVNGRNFLNWDQRLELDAIYVEKLSFILDVKIILQTIKAVLKRKDIGLNIMTDFDIVRMQQAESKSKVR